MANHGKSLIEKIGLDWLPIIIGLSSFRDTATPYFLDRKQVIQKFSGISTDNLDYALQQCEELVKKEDERGEKIEGKAFTLIGITGITTGLVAGIQTLLFDPKKIASTHFLIIIGVFFLLIVVSLIITIYLSTKAVNVGEYVFTYPSANDVFTLTTKKLEDVKHERVIDLYYSFAKNHQLINRKATYLGGSQLWFRNSLLLTLLLTLVLMFSAFSERDATMTVMPSSTITVSSPAVATITPPATQSIGTLPPTATINLILQSSPTDILILSTTSPP